MRFIIFNLEVTFFMNAHRRAVIKHVKMTSYHKVFELEEQVSKYTRQALDYTLEQDRREYIVLPAL